LLLDEGDPPPIASVTPPDIVANKTDDPDAAFRYACAYAAQVMVLDECFASLHEATGGDAGREWTIVFMGARGYPLGEHGRVGGVDPRMYAEQLHVPLIIRFADGLGQLARVSALTTHADLLPTLVDRFDLDRTVEQAALDGASVLPLASSTRGPWREELTSTSATARSIRTAAWCLRENRAVRGGSADSEDATSAFELYVRPDDRWEANDVAKLCPEVIEELEAKLREC
jgi:arylsulfatase A-like enzyme